MTKSTIQPGPGGGGGMPTASPNPGARVGRAIGIFLFLAFTFGGVALCWFVGLRPALRARAAAATWEKVPCTILASTVVERPGGSEEGPTYTADVRYGYVVGGRTYHSDRIDFFPGSAAGREEKLAIVHQYPPGRRMVCYVNPADPTDAVLEPSLGRRGWMLAFPVVFVLFGLVGLVAVLRSGRRDEATGGALGSRSAPTLLAVPNNDVRTLRVSELPVSRFVAFLVVALIFDGALAIFIWQLAAGHAGRIGIAAFWVLVWGAACLALTGAALRSAMAVLNPRATVTLARGAVPPGGSAELQWTFDGRYDRIRRLTLRLEGRELARHRAGGDTRRDTNVTDTNVFAIVPLFETDRNDLIARGKVALHIPAGAMHTFRAPHNQIRWFLVVHGDIPYWPDVNSEFEIEVPPLAARPLAFDAQATTPPTTSPVLADAGVTIRTVGDRTTFSPGDTIAGGAAWSLSATPTHLEVRLLWFTRGTGSPDAQVVDQLAIQNPSMQGERSFTFPVPNGPYSFSGTLISLTWCLEVVAEPKDRSARIPITCAPGGREIQLGALATPMPAGTLSQ